MSHQGELSPHEAGDAEEFAELLNRLKTRSGLSYRQMEERASERGEVLPRSTMADTLRHNVLPRAEMLVAFLVVCGEEHNAEAWLRARDRIATAATQGAESGQRPAWERLPDARLPPDAASPAAAPPGALDDVLASRAPGGAWSRWSRRLPLRSGSRKRLLVAALALAPLALGGYLMLTLTGSGGKGKSGNSPADGTYDVRSVASSLCLSERDGEENGYVYQSGCAHGVPAYALEERGPAVYRIETLHPLYGHGCLGVDHGSTKPGARMVDDYCGNRSSASESFHLERVGAGGYRLRLVHTNACVSVAGGAKQQWTPLLQLPCTPGDTSQIFFLDPIPRPSGIPTTTSNH